MDTPSFSINPVSTNGFGFVNVIAKENVPPGRTRRPAWITWPSFVKWELTITLQVPSMSSFVKFEQRSVTTPVLHTNDQPASIISWNVEHVSAAVQGRGPSSKTKSEKNNQRCTCCWLRIPCPASSARGYCFTCLVSEVERGSRLTLVRLGTRSGDDHG